MPPRKRAEESPEDRTARMAANARKQREDDDEAEKAVEEMIKRSIRKHGA